MGASLTANIISYESVEDHFSYRRSVFIPTTDLLFSGTASTI
jgi:hypothetical protein